MMKFVLCNQRTALYNYGTPRKAVKFEIDKFPTCHIAGKYNFHRNRTKVKLPKGVRHVFKSYFVPISNENEIRTIETATESTRLPLVMLHGFAAGIGFWALNLDDLSQKQSVYAIDLLGFGRSSRPCFPSDGAEAERLYVESIEEWRKKVGLEKLVLLGHSFGGYLACAYTLAYPERVRHLVLADPWGIPEKPPPGEESFEIPRWVKVVAAVLSLFNPLAAIRVAGPYGPSLISKFRPDLLKKYESTFGEGDTRVMEYVYHCNAQMPSGETAFKSLTIPYGWAKYPMIHRVPDIDHNIPMTVLFGSRSWMDTTSGYSIKCSRQDAYVDVQIIKGAGHHIYADCPVEFNAAVNKVCDAVEDSLDYRSVLLSADKQKDCSNGSDVICKDLEQVGDDPIKMVTDL